MYLYTHTHTHTHTYIYILSEQKFSNPPRFPIRIHVKLLFEECLQLKGYLSYSKLFYMVLFSDDLSI